MALNFAVEARKLILEYYFHFQHDRMVCLVFVQGRYKLIMDQKRETNSTGDFRVSVVISLQNWLSESPEQSKNSATPGYMSIFMSRKSSLVACRPIIYSSNRPTWAMNGFETVMLTWNSSLVMALVIVRPFAQFVSSYSTAANILRQTYMPLFFPPPGVSGGSTTAATPAPSPSP